MDPTTLEQLDARLSRIEAHLSTLTDLVEQVAPKLAIATDVADEWVAERLGGDAMNGRVTAGLDAVVALTDPKVLASLTRLAMQAPDLQPFADLGTRLAPSLSRVSSEAVAPVGAFGLMGALSDPQVQQGLGVVLQLTRALGQSASNLPAKS